MIGRVGINDKSVQLSEVLDGNLALKTKIESYMTRENNEESCVNLQIKKQANENEEILRKIISDQNRDIIEIQNLYDTDTKELNSVIQQLNEKLNLIEKEFNELKIIHEHILFRSQTLGNAKEAEKEEIQKEINELEEEIKLKNKELVQYSEILGKTEIEKKKKDDYLRELEKRFIHYKDNTDMIHTENKEMHSKYKSLSSVLDIERQKNRELEKEIEIEALKHLKIVNRELEKEIKETQQSYHNKKQKIKDLQQQFSNFKENAKETENSLKEAIDKLNEQILKKEFSTIARLSEKNKLRKTKTIIDRVENNSKDNIARLINKISNLEADLSLVSEENEKLNRNLNYQKKTLEDKAQVITQRQSKFESNLHKRINDFRLALISNIRRTGEGIEKSIAEACSLLKCKQCDTESKVNYIALPCEHALCKICANNEQEQCIYCGSPSKIIKLNILRTLISHFSMQKSSFNSLRAYLNKDTSEISITDNF